MLPNLQLLEGPINVSKQDQLPLAWATSQHADASQLGLYLAGHDLDGLPAALEDFGAFYESRRQRMTAKLRTLLSVPAAQPADD